MINWKDIEKVPSCQRCRQECVPDSWFGRWWDGGVFPDTGKTEAEEGQLREKVFFFSVNREALKGSCAYLPARQSLVISSIQATDLFICPVFI